MTEQELADLLGRAGIRPAWQGTREARPGFQQQQSPAGALADPRTVPYRRVPTRRDREFSRASLADTTQRGAWSEPRNQIAEAGMNVLETTGAPSFARGVRSIQANEPGRAAGEFSMGALGLLGTASLPFGSGARPPALQRVPRVQEPPAPPAARRVWHVSPHEFEPEPGFPNGRFRTDLGGSGESRGSGVGALAYGPGGYFTESDGVRDFYREQFMRTHGRAHIYEAEIPGDGYMDFDTPFSQQPTNIRDGLREIYGEGPIAPDANARVLNMTEAERMRARGVVGTSFRGGIQDSNEALRNFAVFDGRDINLLRRVPPEELAPPRIPRIQQAIPEAPSARIATPSEVARTGNWDNYRFANDFTEDANSVGFQAPDALNMNAGRRRPLLMPEPPPEAQGIPNAPPRLPETGGNSARGVTIRANSERDHVLEAVDPEGRVVGYLDVELSRDGRYAPGSGPYASSVHVNERSRRQGVATALYSEAERRFGRMVPSDNPSPDAQAFWQSYRPPTPPPRLPGRATDGSVLPMRPREPIRQSLVGGSDDLREAARSGPDAGPVQTRSTAFDDLPSDTWHALSPEQRAQLGATKPPVEIRRTPIADLRRGNAADERKVEGFSDRPSPPILVQGNRVIDGNHRLEVARTRGQTEIDTIDIDGLLARTAPDGGPVRAGRDASEVRYPVGNTEAIVTFTPREAFRHNGVQVDMRLAEPGTALSIGETRQLFTEMQRQLYARIAQEGAPVYHASVGEGALSKLYLAGMRRGEVPAGYKVVSDRTRSDFVFIRNDAFHDAYREGRLGSWDIVAQSNRSSRNAPNAGDNGFAGAIYANRWEGGESVFLPGRLPRTAPDGGATQTGRAPEQPRRLYRGTQEGVDPYAPSEDGWLGPGRYWTGTRQRSTEYGPVISEADVTGPFVTEQQFGARMAELGGPEVPENFARVKAEFEAQGYRGIRGATQDEYALWTDPRATDQFYRVEPEAFRRHHDALTAAREAGRYVDQEVPISSLTGTNERVSPTYTGARNILDHTDGQPPWVYQTPDGRNYIMDGHNRIAAAASRGETNVRVRVFSENPSRTGPNASRTPDGGSAQRGFTLREHPNAPGEGTLRLTQNTSASGMDAYPAQIGAIDFVRTPDGFRIVQSTVKPEHRGQGAGIELYEELVRRADAEGLPVMPDPAGVSPDAAHVYDALERRGYQVTRDANGVPTELRPVRARPNAGPPRPPPMFPGGRNR